jgi:adenosylcobinamide kinase / adenosylcobinamide-phosphate guanylyltransferase
MGKIIFVTGGARSGKSTFAEKLALESEKVIYIATSIPFDNEMKRRVEIHRERRNKNWKTIETFNNFDKTLSPELTGVNTILLDCITVMITNIMFEEYTDWDNIKANEAEKIQKKVLDEIDNLIKIIKNFIGTSIIVSNEVGLGLVPPTPLGRYFRDIAGFANQKIASKADEVYFVVSGIPIKIKG